MAINGLVPARFLTLTAHLVLTIMLYWAKCPNVLACLPASDQSCLPTGYQSSLPTSSQFNSINTNLIIGISVSIGLFAFELVGFLFGVSMFVHSQAMISMAAHAAGAVALSFYMFNVQPCYDYWYIFGFTDVLPCITEICTFIAVLGCRKGPY